MGASNIKQIDRTLFSGKVRALLELKIKIYSPGKLRENREGENYDKQNEKIATFMSAWFYSDCCHGAGNAYQQSCR